MSLLCRVRLSVERDGGAVIAGGSSLLPRRGGVGRAPDQCPADALPRADGLPARSASGCPAAPAARRRTPWPSLARRRWGKVPPLAPHPHLRHRCRSRRHRSGPWGPLPGNHLRRRFTATAGTLLHPGRGRISDRATHPRHGRLRRSRSHPGSAARPARSRELSEPADLPPPERQDRALRVLHYGLAAGRLPGAGRAGDDRRATRPLLDGRCKAQHLCQASADGRRQTPRALEHPRPSDARRRRDGPPEPRPQRPTEGQPSLLSSKERRLLQFQRELGDARRRLRTTFEDLECANEELQSMVEELRSSNEELEGTNDALERRRKICKRRRRSWSASTTSSRPASSS